jgi:hypothetical protein
MKKVMIILMVLGLFFMFGCTTKTISSFDECVAAGYPVMESYPQQCKVGDIIFVEEIDESPIEDADGKHICTAEEKQAEICTMDYTPVCGDNGITYGNACSACASGEIDFYIQGECVIMTMQAAKAIAESSECTEKGTLTNYFFHNPNSQTWWFDLEMMPEFENKLCNPACVVFEETGEAEINWRCTGALPTE